MNDFKKHMMSENRYDAFMMVNKYLTLLEQYLQKTYSKKEHNGFVYDLDRMSGTWSWINKNDTQVMATLGWDDQNDIPITVMDSSGNELYTGTIKSFGVDKLTFNVKKDITNYLKAIAPILKKYNK